MKTVFVSGCFDIIHAGHIEFFKQAKALGDYLIVSFASDDVLMHHKHRKPSIPQEHKKVVLESIKYIDEVVIGDSTEVLGLDFKYKFIEKSPNILAVTTDDKYETIKRELCAATNAQYVVLEKKAPVLKETSTSEILRYIKAPQVAPLRVDFAGGWLDVPRYSKSGEFIVNCAISPTVTLTEWSYEKSAGLGGSGAWALLNGYDGVASELNTGVGWQDPAVIKEGGLCVWKSGAKPDLLMKTNGQMLVGKMAVLYTGYQHDTPSIADNLRNYDKIALAGLRAKIAIEHNNYHKLCEAVKISYEVQQEEGMEELVCYGEEAKKYCGGGFGGYALYMFKDEKHRDDFCMTTNAIKIEPYTGY